MPQESNSIIDTFVLLVNSEKLCDNIEHSTVFMNIVDSACAFIM